MGDLNSLSHWQHFMQRVFVGDKPYIDDLAICDESFDAHLESVFQRCVEFGIHLSPAKCKFNLDTMF